MPYAHMVFRVNLSLQSKHKKNEESEILTLQKIVNHVKDLKVS